MKVTPHILEPAASLALGAEAPWLLAAIGLPLALTAFLLICYRRCPPNCLMVVAGPAGASRASSIRTRGGFVWPLIRERSLIRLDPMELDLAPSDAGPNGRPRTSVAISIRAQVSRDAPLRDIAAVRLFGLTSRAVREEVSRAAATRGFAMLGSTRAAARDPRTLARDLAEEIGEDLATIGVELTDLRLTIGGSRVEPSSSRARVRVSRNSRGDPLIVAV